MYTYLGGNAYRLKPDRSIKLGTGPYKQKLTPGSRKANQIRMSTREECVRAQALGTCAISGVNYRGNMLWTFCTEYCATDFSQRLCLHHVPQFVFRLGGPGAAEHHEFKHANGGHNAAGMNQQAGRADVFVPTEDMRRE